MGNNHTKYFDKDKRKLIIIGLQNSGKSTIVKTLSKDYKYVDNKQDLQIVDIQYENCKLCIFDMGGNKRQRIFWRQNYYGSQGVLYVIDPNEDLTQALKELTQVAYDADLKQTPIAIFVNMRTPLNIQGIKDHIAKFDNCIEVFQGSALEYGDIEQALKWLGRKMKPI